MRNFQSKTNSKRKTDRPKRMPSSERRIQLLNTAREMILRDGIGALTMSALADAVGVAKPIVYKHFKNSEDVVIEILKEHSRGSVQIAAKRVKGAKTVYDFLDGVIDSLFDYIKEEGAIVRSITNGFSSSENVDAFFLAQQEKSHRVFLHLLKQQGVAENRVSLAAYALMEMINMTILEYAQHGNPTDRETLKEMVRGALKGLVKGPGTKPVVPVSLLEPYDSP